MATPVRGGDDNVLLWNWNDLVAWSQQQGPTSRLSSVQEQITQSRVREAEADSTVRVLAGASLARVREPVTDELSRSYERTQAQAGIRWGLLGASETQARQLLDAHANQTLGKTESEARELQARVELAKFYNAYVRSQQREQIVRLFLEGRESIAARLQQRTQGGAMLQAEKLSLLRLYDEAAMTQAREQNAQKAALRQMEFLTGQTLVPRQAPPAGASHACLTPQALEKATTSHPLLLKAKQAASWAEERLNLRRYGGVEAGVQIGYALTHDFGGSNGHNTVIGVDISIPWEWKAQQNARKAQDRGYRDEAEEKYAQLLRQFELESRQAWDAWQLEEQNIQNQTRHFAAAMEALRVARLRLQASDANGLAQLILAQHALHVAAMEVVDAYRKRDLAAVALWYYAPDCPLQEMPQDPAREILTQTETALKNQTRKGHS
ncbi:MAG: TolC family protein [Zoogloeaceae bacterium]|nr:TolC family protein [Zoogloeaceae bacterium]